MPLAAKQPSILQNQSCLAAMSIQPGLQKQLVDAIRKAILQSLAAQLLAIKSPVQVVNVTIAGDDAVTLTPNQLKPQRSQDLER